MGAVSEFAGGAPGHALVVGSVFDKSPTVRHARVIVGTIRAVLALVSEVPLGLGLARKGGKPEGYVLRRLPPFLPCVCRCSFLLISARLLPLFFLFLHRSVCPFLSLFLLRLSLLSFSLLSP